MLNEDELKKEIKNRQFRNLYLIYGSEGYLKQHYVSQIASKAVEKDYEDFNLHKLDGASTDLNEIYDCVCAFAMMGSYTCTVVKDFPIEKYIGDRGKLDPEFENVLDSLGDSSILVFWMDTTEVDPKATKWSRVIKLADSRGAAVAIDKRSVSSLAKLLTDSAEKKGCTLSREDALYMVNVIGDDMNTLRNELDKVCGYVGSGTVTRAHIDKTVVISVEAKIFSLSRFIAKHDAENALETLSNLFKLREEPVSILAVLSKAYVDMYRAKALHAKNLPNAKLSEIFPSSYKGREFIISNAASDAKQYTPEQLKKALFILNNADTRLKTTSENGQTVLEETVIRLLRLS